MVLLSLVSAARDAERKLRLCVGGEAGAQGVMPALLALLKDPIGSALLRVIALLGLEKQGADRFPGLEAERAVAADGGSLVGDPVRLLRASLSSTRLFQMWTSETSEYPPSELWALRASSSCTRRW